MGMIISIEPWGNEIFPSPTPIIANACSWAAAHGVKLMGSINDDYDGI